MAAGAKGPLECVVLNACSTEKMGRLLRTHNVPYVMCWKTPVQDETAKALCELFYRALVQDGSGERDYRRAFLGASNALRTSAYTHGAAQRPREEEDVTTSNAMLYSGTTWDDSVGLDILHDQAVGGVAQGQATNRGGHVGPWHQEDVVLFLSKDGDCEPIYLWRETKVPLPLLLTPIAANIPADGAESGCDEEVGDAALKALFVQHGLGALCADLCRELGVDGVDDLTHVKPKDLDALPKYVKDKLKPVHKRKFKAMIASQPSVVAPQDQSRVLGTTFAT